MSATVEVATDPPYPVLVGAGVLDQVAATAGRGDRLALLVDGRVWELHGERLAGLGEAPRLELPGLEATKSLERLGEALDFMAAAGLSRRSTLVTLGGGTIGDLGGLAASLFKRGVAVVHCPTTLLAQVDASVGGKTAINLGAGKNLAGTFHQPQAVFADVQVLRTLPEEERASGLGEVVKTALIGGEGDLARLEDGADELARAGGEDADLESTIGVIAACVEVKARVVAEDPTERGPRRALNLGHTFAHAIEHAAGFGAVPHGVAVAAGLGLALRASALVGLLADHDLPGRVAALLERLGLPTGLDDLRTCYGSALPTDVLLAGLAHDKKGSVGAPELVLPVRAGELEVAVPLEPGTLAELLA